MRTWWRVAAVVGFALWMSGCVSLGVHRSARPIGKDRMEVGFSAGYPYLLGIGVVNGTAGEFGGAEGYLRYGVGNRLDFSLVAGGTGVTPRLDWSFIHRKRFNVLAGFGLGLGAAHLAVNGDQLMGGVIVAPDFTGLMSFGGPQREWTLGLRVLVVAGGGLMNSAYLEDTQTAVTDQSATVVGGVIAYTRRGKRLNVTPELDLYLSTKGAGAAVGQFGLLVIPSVTFALAR